MTRPDRTADALVAYGYVEEEIEGVPTFTKYDAKGRPIATQQWVWAGDHWDRFELGKRVYEGMETDVFKGLIRQQYPYQYRSEYVPTARYEHPDRWVWEWPDDDVFAAYSRSSD